MRKITNTSNQNPLINLMHATLDGGIESQETTGQRELCESTQLPHEGSDDPKLHFIKWGKRCKDDPIFREAELSPGYRVVPTDHSMWSEIVDSSGKVVAKIFYKAASYDRSATIYAA